VGDRSGVPVEDLGVTTNDIHHMTKKDVLESNVDLIEHAAGLLAGMQDKAYALSAIANTSPGDGITVTATTSLLDRLDVYINGRPQLTLDVADGPNTFNLPAQLGGAKVEIRGYSQGQLAASTRL
jgi:hypothetical protein